QRALGRFARVELDLLFLLAQITPDASQLATCSLSADICIEVSACLFPDFRASRLEVSLDVVRVVELRRHPVLLGIEFANAFQFLESKINIGFAAGRVNHLSPVSDIHLLALFAHAFGHHDDARIALYSGYERTSDAGVAGRAFENSHTGLQIAALLSTFDHIEIDSILERARR